MKCIKYAYWWVQLVCLALCSQASNAEEGRQQFIIQDVLSLLESHEGLQQTYSLMHLQEIYKMELERKPNDPETIACLAIIRLAYLAQIVNLDETYYDAAADIIRDFEHVLALDPNILGGNVSRLMEEFNSILLPSPYSYQNSGYFMRYLSTLPSSIPP